MISVQFQEEWNGASIMRILKDNLSRDSRRY